MKTALRFDGSAPTSGARVFSSLYRTGAGSASDGGIASSIERIERYVVFSNVIPHVD